VDDVVQEAYVRLLRARTAGPIVTAKAFLFVAAKNLALNHLRDSRQERTESLAEPALSSVYIESAGIPESIARAEDFQVLIRAIQSLPERCRQVVTLRKIYGLSQKETAARLGIAEHTVEAQSGIGLRRCAEFFRSYGYGPEGRT
jgi:RNA polymerase sigma-70 factor (ECF subfamily)